MRTKGEPRHRNGAGSLFVENDERKKEALSLPKKWFPQMENFSWQIKNNKSTINDLLAENEQLETKANEKDKMKDTMERARLESELQDIQRLGKIVSRRRCW